MTTLVKTHWSLWFVQRLLITWIIHRCSHRPPTFLKIYRMSGNLILSKYCFRKPWSIFLSFSFWNFHSTCPLKCPDRSSAHSFSLQPGCHFEAAIVFLCCTRFSVNTRHKKRCESQGCIGERLCLGLCWGAVKWCLCVAFHCLWMIAGVVFYTGPLL